MRCLERSCRTELLTIWKGVQNPVTVGLDELCILVAGLALEITPYNARKMSHTQGNCLSERTIMLKVKTSVRVSKVTSFRRVCLSLDRGIVGRLKGEESDGELRNSIALAV